MEACAGTSVEKWTVAPNGALRSAGKCLTANGATAALSACHAAAMQRWHYTLAGNLINRHSHLCLTGSTSGSLSLQACGHNLASQIWSLPNKLVRQK
jgi:hypothetical protein